MPTRLLKVKTKLSEIDREHYALIQEGLSALILAVEEAGEGEALFYIAQAKAALQEKLEACECAEWAATPSPLSDLLQ